MYFNIIALICLWTTSAVEATTIRQLLEFQMSRNRFSPLVKEANNLGMETLIDSHENPALLPERTTPNKVFSPLGIVSLLAIMRECSAGPARKQYDNHALFRNRFRIGRLFGDWYDILRQTPNNHRDNDIVFLRIKNLMAYDSRLNILGSFFAKIKGYEVNGLELDFANSPEDARSRINDKIRNDTNNLIPEFLQAGDVSADTKLIISNTIYFQGDWQYKFDESQPRIFYLQDGTAVSIATMTTTALYRFHIRCRPGDNPVYCVDDNYPDIIEVPFVGGHHQMVIISPNSAISTLEQVEERFQESINSWRSSLRNDYVRLSMPKFQLNHEIDLNTIFRQQNLSVATKISAYGSLTLTPFITTKVMHKTKLEVQEKGVSVASASGLVVNIRMGQPNLSKISLNINRPFLFFIEDKNTKTILFLGRVTHPR